MRLTDIADNIQQMETFYSDLVANNADPKDLRLFWKKIQDLRTQFLLLETFESVWGHPLLTDPDLSLQEQPVLE